MDSKTDKKLHTEKKLAQENMGSAQLFPNSLLLSGSMIISLGSKTIDGPDVGSVRSVVQPYLANHADAGYAWVVCGAAFLAHFLALGFAYSIGIYYAVFLQVFQGSASVTAWISSLNFGTLCVIGPLASIMISRCGIRITMITGTLISSGGLVVSSAMNNVYLLAITLGVVTGAGLGLIFAASIVVVSFYFERWRSFAMGISMSGSGFGTIMFPWMSRYLIDQYSWRGALLLTAAINLNICVAAMLMRPTPLERLAAEQQRREAEERKKSTDIMNKKPIWANFHLIVFRMPRFWCLMVNNFLYTFGMSVVYTHVAAYAASMQLGHSSGKVIISCLGMSNILGRILLGAVGHWRSVDVVLLFVSSYFLAGIAIIISGAWTSFFGVSAAMVAFGFFSGAFGPLLCEVTCMIVGVERFNHAYGYLMALMAVGTTLGAPCAGILYDATAFYPASFYLGGSTLLLSSLMMIPTMRTCRRKSEVITSTLSLNRSNNNNLRDIKLREDRTLYSSIECAISSV